MKSLIRDKKLLKNGGRKAVAISETELEEKIVSRAMKFDEDVGDLHDAIVTLVYEDAKIKKDLSKVDFDFENVDVGDDGYLSGTGFHTLANGFTYLLCGAGGDWETPVGFIVYWDGKTIRGYIPTLGNTFNLEFKCAFGSEESYDENYDEICEQVYEEFSENDECYFNEAPHLVKLLQKNGISFEDYDGEYDLDIELFEEDIEHRIVIE